MKVPELTTHRAIAFSDGQARRCDHLEAHFAAVTASAMADHALSCRFPGNRLPCVHTRAQSPGNALVASSGRAVAAGRRTRRGRIAIDVMDVSWLAGAPSMLRIGIWLAGARVRRSILPNIRRTAQVDVRTIVMASPIIPMICMPAGFMDTRVFARSTA